MVDLFYRSHSGVNHYLTIPVRTVAPLSRPSYGPPGDCGGLPHYSDGWIMRQVIVIAAAGLSLAGCSSLSWDAFKSAPPAVPVQLASTPPGADARTSLGPGCTTPCSVNITPPEGHRFHRHLHDGQVPAGHRPGACDPCARRLDVERIDANRSQSDRRRTSADGPTEAGPETAPAEKAEAAQGCPGRARRGIAVPQPGASTCGRAGTGGRTAATTTSAARPLIACTAADNGTGPRCRLCQRGNVPTLWSRGPFADLTAAALKRHM